MYQATKVLQAPPCSCISQQDVSPHVASTVKLKTQHNKSLLSVRCRNTDHFGKLVSIGQFLQVGICFIGKVWGLPTCLSPAEGPFHYLCEQHL